MKYYELVLDPENDNQGVFAISLVESPAIDVDFVALSKQAKKVKFAKVDDEKRLLMGAVLIPDQAIYRKEEGEEFYIYFKEDTIRKTAHHYMFKGKQHNTTLEHHKPLEGNTVVESWIVEDMEKDKSALVNLNAPKGSWVIMMKIDNDEVWDDFVKTGEVNGFSIEGYFGVNLADAKRKMLTDEEKLDKIKELLSDA